MVLILLSANLFMFPIRRLGEKNQRWLFKWLKREPSEFINILLSRMAARMSDYSLRMYLNFYKINKLSSFKRTKVFRIQSCKKIFKRRRNFQMRLS